MFLFPLLALVWLPLCPSLKIFIPGQVVQGEDVPVQLTYESVDVFHNSFFLKKYGLDENKLYKPLFPVEEFVGNTTVYISFFKPMRYVVIAVNDPDNQNLKLTDALATSNPIAAERKKCPEGDDGEDNNMCSPPWKDDKDDDDDDDEDEDESESLSETLATSSGSSKKTPLIVGSVLGSVAIVVIIALLVYLLYRLRWRLFSPHRTVCESASPDSFRQHTASRPSASLHPVRTPSMVSANSYSDLIRASPPPTYSFIHQNSPALDVEAPITRAPMYSHAQPNAVHGQADVSSVRDVAEDPTS